MEEKILTIKIEKKEHLMKVLEKIEKDYPNHGWNHSRKKPTNFVTENVGYIHLYNDNSMTYSSDVYYSTVEKIISSSLFLEEEEIQHRPIDNVNHPLHYQGANECIDVMLAMFGIEAVKAFCKCNAYKYRFRADKKNGAEDRRKAEFYETYLIKLNERTESNE